LLVASLVAGPVSASRADSGPTATVRDYFHALGHKDWGHALALTAGAAQARTAQILGTLQREAARADADVELKVRALNVAERPGASLGRRLIPVEVTFDIDVVGHKWFFKKVARHLAGTAQFYVSPRGPSRILAIDGSLD
jgi:hypothetical protein